MIDNRDLVSEKMVKSEIIFIGNDYLPSKSRNSFINHFLVPPHELPLRIITSLIPQRRIYVDLLGPSLALLFMAALLHYGHALKLPSAAITSSPSSLLLSYAIVMPLMSYALSRIGQSKIAFLETVSLLGYSLYGHVFTLSLSMFWESQFFFFVCFFVFGGLSALRVVLVLLRSIPLPVARLIVCSFVATLHLLFLVFIHFAYMHRTFVYGSKGSL